MSAGQDFVKRIGVVGCVIFLGAAVLFVALCLTLKGDPLKDYVSPQDDVYWAQHPEELAAELNGNVLPGLAGKPSCEATERGVVLISVEASRLDDLRELLMARFDPSLLEFSAK